MAFEHGQCSINEVSRAVVEGHHDRVPLVRVLRFQIDERVIEGRAKARIRESSHLLIEDGGRQIQLDPRTTADAVVDENHDSSPRRSHAISGCCEVLDGIERDAPQAA
jgi:hypothetical protein